MLVQMCTHINSINFRTPTKFQAKKKKRPSVETNYKDNQ